MTTTWMLDALGDDTLGTSREFVARSLTNTLIPTALVATRSPAQQADDQESFSLVSGTLELAVADLLYAPENRSELRKVSALAFEHLKSALSPQSTLGNLKVACYGVLSERTSDVSRFLKSLDLKKALTEPAAWPDVVRSKVELIWLSLLRKDGWQDLDLVQNTIVWLRNSQREEEARFFSDQARQSKTDAWELIALYHLGQAGAVLGSFTTDGRSDDTFDIREQLQAHFDRSIVACDRAELVELHSLVTLLSFAAEALVANSIWTVTRAVNSRVTKFVERLAARDSTRPVFEMLPPQRVVLRQNGLLGSSSRSVVVSLPTSSGKTLIAQFRILQALNQFDHEKGWVAYIAPTRALVNQITRRLRRDFIPLGINVEKLSPALEIDGVEDALLNEKGPDASFRILVCTPEKLDLLLRGGWEAKIQRPLTLVVVDEAHNLGFGERGLRLELLLSTINRECRNSQFLLLTPFIVNREEIAKWLSPDSGRDLSVEFDWQPNDRLIALSVLRTGSGKNKKDVHLKPLITSKPTIFVPNELTLYKDIETSRVGNQSKLAAATALRLADRGTVIVVANKVPDTWMIARLLKDHGDYEFEVNERVATVITFVENEFGADFELIDCLRRGIGLHHSGLSDEIRASMEWLMENRDLRLLVATTTIAQGVNFPVSSVVLASHQYPFGQDMPNEDFWNLAGRVGRADQDALGVVSLVAVDDAKEQLLADYVNENARALNSTLLEMMADALRDSDELNLSALFYKKEWSAFLQFIAHTYRQIGDHSKFDTQVEQVLRGTYGFQKLRKSNPYLANRLVAAVNQYSSVLQGKPLQLVDATGFSWESVSVALGGLKDEGLSRAMWEGDSLFEPSDKNLKRAFGVLFKIPELRKELQDACGGRGRNKELLANIVKDWVAGRKISDIAIDHFKGTGDTASITATCRSIYSRLITTASWGLGALQSLTIGSEFDKMTEADAARLRNIPAKVFYGVQSDEAVRLRLLGVPRLAAEPLAKVLSHPETSTLKLTRNALHSTERDVWKEALGERGQAYRAIWRVIDGYT